MTEKDMKQLMDKLDQTLIAVRDSASPSLSDVIRQMTEKLDLHIQTHEDDVKDIKNDIAVLKASVQPAVAAVDTANGLRKGVVWVAGFIIATGSIWVALGHFKQWIKQ